MAGNCLDNSSTIPSTGCVMFFDGLVCWPNTQPGESAMVPCSSVQPFKQLTINYFSEGSSSLYAYRDCLEKSQQWAEKANYSECLTAISRYEDPLEYYYPTEEEVAKADNKRILACITFYLSIISLTFLIISLLIFSFKSLQCERVRVHRNFMISLVLLYLVTILYYHPYITAGNQYVWYKSQPWMCRLMLSCLMFGYLAPVFWMFIEGVYLHSRLATNIFDSSAPFKLYYCIGWVLPTLMMVIWVIGMYFTCEEPCWEDQSNHNTAYIIIIPMMVALAINLLFLINIVRIVVTKLRNTPSLSTQQLQFRKAVRATLILFPLLGITNLLFFINPRSLKKREYELTYMYVNAVLKSSQGILLSLLYCFFNTEVQEAIKRILRKIKIRMTVNRSFNRQASCQRGSIFLHTLPRENKGPRRSTQIAETGLCGNSLKSRETSTLFTSAAASGAMFNEREAGNIFASHEIIEARFISREAMASKRRASGLLNNREIGGVTFNNEEATAMVDEQQEHIVTINKQETSSM